MGCSNFVFVLNKKRESKKFFVRISVPFQQKDLPIRREGFGPTPSSQEQVSGIPQNLSVSSSWVRLWVPPTEHFEVKNSRNMANCGLWAPRFW